MLLNVAVDEFIQYLSVTSKSGETIKAYTSDLKAFIIFMERQCNCAVYMNEIEMSDIENYLFYLKKKNLQSASRSRNLYTLRSFFNYCYKNKYCDWNATLSVEPVKVQRKERTFLSEEEVMELVGAIDHPLVSVVVTTLFYTGLRISECVNLQVQHVDFQNKVIHVIKGKGNKDRNVPMNKNLYAILENYSNTIMVKDSKYFFATEKSKSITPAYVNRVINDTVKKLKWSKHVSAHILRHSFASNLIKNGVNLVHVQKLLGHSNLKVTSIYTHANMEDLEESINTL